MQTTEVPSVSSMSSTFHFRYCKMAKLTEDIAATLFWNTCAFYLLFCTGTENNPSIGTTRVMGIQEKSTVLGKISVPSSKEITNRKTGNII
jgi:hypothetical protein